MEMIVIVIVTMMIIIDLIVWAWRELAVYSDTSDTYSVALGESKMVNYFYYFKFSGNDRGVVPKSQKTLL